MRGEKKQESGFSGQHEVSKGAEVTNESGDS